MPVFWITTTIANGRGGLVQFPFDTGDDATVSVDDLARQLARDGFVTGDKLDLRPDGAGGRQVVARQRAALGRSGVVMMQPYTKPTWEEMP